MKVSWFSAGVSSAVATKLYINKIDKIIYQHIDDQHPDTMRFVKDCEGWFVKEIEILQSPYKNVEDVVSSQRYINGTKGAPCTKILKRRVRQEWELDNEKDITYIWGLDLTEKHRADRTVLNMPNQKHIFPLIEKELTKSDTHAILRRAGIKRPAMYDLGYPNNNCIGCVKGGMGYWLAIKRDFPEVFDSRAKLEREIGASCIKHHYLDTLKEGEGRKLKPIVEDCGIFCELLTI
jgi:3'-phosphoadenosine 5'-phosphosulfate sulfotransferase (PAPS reductase)/FAD synthetase